MSPTGKGSSYEDPFLIEDLYDAAIANGWNITKAGTTYNIYDLLIHAAQYTYVKFLDCTLNWIGSLYADHIRGDGSRWDCGYVQLGEYDGVRAYNGCVIDFGGLNVNARTYFDKVYDSTIKGNFVIPNLFVLKVNTEMITCKIMNGSALILYDTQAFLKKVFITKCAYGIRTPAPGVTTEDVFITGAARGVWMLRASGVTLRSMSVTGNDVDFWNSSALNEQQENTLVDCVYDSYKNEMWRTATAEAWCILNIKEYLKLKITDTDGNLLENANVNLYDKNDDLVFDLVTDGDGEIPQQEVLRLRDEVNIAERTITYYNPFRMVIEYTGKQTYESKININSKQDLQIALASIEELNPVGFTNQAETEVLRHLFLNEDILNIGDTAGLLASSQEGNFYIALFTGDPGETGSTTSEATYTGYARASVSRGDTGWYEGMGIARNINPINFPECMGGEETITHYAIMKENTGDKMLCYGELQDPINIVKTSQPQFGPYSIEFRLN